MAKHGFRDWMISTVVLACCGLGGCGDDDTPKGGDGSGGTQSGGGSSGDDGGPESGGNNPGSGGRSSGSGGKVGSGGGESDASAGGTEDASSAGGGASGPDAGGDAETDAESTADAGDGGVHIGDRQRAVLATLTPLPATVPADPTNRVADNEDAAALGQKLFFDEKFSGPLRIDSDLGNAAEVGKVSCASCHSSGYLDDERSVPETVSLGADHHSRNAPPLVNSSFYRWTNWGGRFCAQWELPLAVVEAGVIMNSNRLKVAHRIFDAYRSEYESIFGDMDAAIATFPADGKPKPAPTSENPAPADGVWETDLAPDERTVINTVLVNYSKAIAAYVRLLVSRDAPFDAWMAGDEDALDSSAKRGARVFVDAGCASCHSGPHFADNEFHNIGVPQVGEKVPPSDDGHFKDVPALLGSPFNCVGSFSDDPDPTRLAGLTNPMPESARGAFRTPSLRGIALTAPYMHAGQLATLEDVVEFYDRGGDVPTSGAKDPRMIPLHLTDREKEDLVNFLKALTGDSIPSTLLEDTAAP